MNIDSVQSRRRLISLTPLIDVVLILLVFFMLASSFLDWRSIKLEMATSSGAQSAGEGALLIRVKSNGTIDLNGEAISIDNLVTKISSRLKIKPGQPILIQPEQGATLQPVVVLLDRLAAIGAHNISLSKQ